MTAAADTFIDSPTERLAAKGSRLPRWRISLARAFFDTGRRATFYQSLARYIARSPRLPDALHAIWDIDTHGGRKSGGTMDIAVPYWLNLILHHGATVQEIFEGWLPHHEAAILAAIYDMGLRPDLLRHLADNITAIHRARVKILVTALPGIAVLLMILGGFWALSVWYWPQFFTYMPKSSLQGQAATLMKVSTFFSDYGLTLIVGITIAIAFVIHSLPHLTGSLRRKLDNYWPWSNYRDFTAISWVIAFGTLIEAQRNQPEILQTLAERSNPYLREILDALILRDDVPVAEALEEIGWPSYAYIRDFSHAMADPKPGEALEQLAGDWITQKIARLAAAAEIVPLVTSITVGLFIAWFAFATNDISTAAMNGVPTSPAAATAPHR